MAVKRGRGKANKAKKRLSDSKFKKMWKKAEAKEGGFWSPPDGQFLVKIEEWKFGEDKNNDLYVLLVMEILGTHESGSESAETVRDLTGKTFSKYISLRGEEEIERFKGMLLAFDEDLPDDSEEMDDYLADKIGRYLDVRCETKGDNQFINIDAEVDPESIEFDDEGSTEGSEEETEGSEDPENDPEEENTDESEGDDDVITADDIKKMGKTDLNKIIEDYELEVKTTLPLPKKRKAIIEELELE